MSNEPESTPEPVQPPKGFGQREALAIIFAALLAFLPIPFLVPFWAMAVVPVSFLVISAGAGGLAYGLLCSLVLYRVAKLLCWLIYQAEERSTRIRLVTALVLTLSVLSLLPIYKPGLDPPKPAVNIIGLFRAGIPTGQ